MSMTSWTGSNLEYNLTTTQLSAGSAYYIRVAAVNHYGYRDPESSILRDWRIFPYITSPSSLPVYVAFADTASHVWIGSTLRSNILVTVSDFPSHVLASSDLAASVSNAGGVTSDISFVFVGDVGYGAQLLRLNCEFADGGAFEEGCSHGHTDWHCISFGHGNSASVSVRLSSRGCGAVERNDSHGH